MVNWLSKKQTAVSLSTTEAKYIPLSCATMEVIWLKRLLEALGIGTNKPIVMMEDNQGAIALAQNPVMHRRTKHTAIKYHFVKEAVHEGIASPQYCHTKEMIADALTKPLPKHQFQVCELCELLL